MNFAPEFIDNRNGNTLAEALVGGIYHDPYVEAFSRERPDLEGPYATARRLEPTDHEQRRMTARRE